MLDYRMPLDYALLRRGDRIRDSRDLVASENRGVRRIFRVVGSRPAIREMGRR